MPHTPNLTGHSSWPCAKYAHSSQVPRKPVAAEGHPAHRDALCTGPGCSRPKTRNHGGPTVLPPPSIPGQLLPSSAARPLAQAHLTTTREAILHQVTKSLDICPRAGTRAVPKPHAGSTQPTTTKQRWKNLVAATSPAPDRKPSPPPAARQQSTPQQTPHWNPTPASPAPKSQMAACVCAVCVTLQAIHGCACSL